MLEEERNVEEVLPGSLVGEAAKRYFRLFRAELEEIYPLAESDVALLVNYCNMQAKLDNLNKTISDNPLVLDKLRINANQMLKNIYDLTRQQSVIAATLGLGVLNRNRLKKTFNINKKAAAANNPEVPKLLQFAKKG